MACAGSSTATRPRPPIKAELTERVAALAARGHRRPGSAPSSSATTPARRGTSAASTADCAEVGIASIREDLPATATPGRDRGRGRRGSTPTRRAPATSCSCRCPKGIDTNAMLELIDPDKDADGLHPTNLGRLVLRVDERDHVAAAVHARAGSSSCCERYGRPGRGQARRRRRPRDHRRPLASGSCSPARRINATVTLTPHRARRTWRPTRAGPTSSSPPPGCRASSRPTWSSPAPSCSTSASAA